MSTAASTIEVGGLGRGLRQGLRQGLRHRRGGERGMTIIELMVSLIVTLLVVEGAMLIVIATAQRSKDGWEVTESQRGARAAFSIFADELGRAGLGLPRRLAFKRFLANVTLNADAEVEEDACPNSPELEIAALDYLRQWPVSSLAEGTITLADVNPVPHPDENRDIALAEGEWVFFYQNPRFESGATGSNHGHALLRVSPERPAGDERVRIGSKAFGAQSDFNMSQSFGAGHAPVLLRARVSKFGLRCLPAGNAVHNYLYWQLSSNPTEKVPVATNVQALRLRFALDAQPADAPDGLPDDTDGDGDFDTDDFIDEPTLDQLATATAVEVKVTICLRGEPDSAECLQPDKDHPAENNLRDFVQVIPLRNMNTRSSDFVFIDNTGLAARLP